MEHLSSENELKLLKAVELLDKIVLVGNEVLKKIDSFDYQSLTFICINFLKRFNGAFDSISILLKQYKNHSNVETSIGLIIRASLLDVIVLSYLNTFADKICGEDIESTDKFYKIINEFMSEQLMFALKHLILLRNRNQISTIEFEAELNIVHTSFIHLFNSENIDKSDPTKNLIYKKTRSIKEYYNIIQSDSLTKIRSQELYNLYTYYSKYDHFGSMTHFLQTDNIAFNLTRILISLENMIFGFDASLNILYSPVDILKKEKEVLETLKNQFENLIK